jgi:hypothetical protein
MKDKFKIVFLPILILVTLTSLANAREYSLRDAAGRGDLHTVKMLLDQGYDVNMSDRNGYTALHLAASSGKTEMVKLLLSKGAFVEAKHYGDYTPLMDAALNGHRETVKALIEGGANTDMAIARFESYPSQYSDAYKAKAAIKLIEKVIPKEATITTAPSISKEDLKTILQAAVEDANKSQKNKTEREAMKTDIDKPNFSDVDRVMGDNDLAVIVGIEGYSSLPKSDYSYDDAKLVGNYAKALGFKPRNIELLLDEKATKSTMEKIIKTWLPNKAKPESKVFIYYSGHGAPEPKTGDAYIVPYDGDPNYLHDTGYALKSLYESLGKLHVAEITVVLDACFSGSGGRSLLAKGARPLVMMKTALPVAPNMVVLTATQGSQISTSSPDKGHGIFTYYFLKALKDGKTNVAEIYEYLKPKVEDDAKVINVQQSPSLNPAPEKLIGRFNLRK